MYIYIYKKPIQEIRAQSAGTAEYTDCISADMWDLSPNECPDNDTKQSDG